MIKFRPILVGVMAFALLLGMPVASVQAQTAADLALDAIDELAHQWEEGAISAEDALEAIEEIIHDVPASQRTGMLVDIDDVVHHWEDGDLTAEEAMEQIEAILHGAAHTHDAATPAPATTGNAGLVSEGTSTMLTLSLLAVLAVIIGSARAAGGRIQR